LELGDAYRKIEPGGGYTWARGTIFSRLDYIFVSNSLLGHIQEVKNDWTFDRSDHAAVRIRVNIPEAKTKGPGLPRVNAEILKKEPIRIEFIDRVKEAMNDTPSSWGHEKKLEFLKVLTRSVLSELSGREKKIEEIEYEALCGQLNMLKNNYAESLVNGVNIPNAQETITALEMEVEKIQKSKADRLAELAKSKWYDEGEKSNKYFLNLLKRRKNESTIKILEDGEKIAQSQKEIEKLILEFYTNLYSEDKSLTNDYDSFFPDLPRLNEDARRDLDRPITLEELEKTLATCQESAPGPDGIPYLVYKKCWEVFGIYILNAWNSSIARGILPDFNRTSTIMLIPKEGKDPKKVGNWRPITLSNCDLKIFTKLISNRVSKVLPKIILNTQTAYIPGRAVHDNLRMFEFYKNYCSKNNVDAVLLSLDAAKAFDSVDHNYMFEALRRYGFSETFISVVRTLYKEIKADILVNGFRSTMIRIERCVKQGDAFSCAMFIICLDPVLRNIENNKRIKHVEIKLPLSNRKIKNKTGAFADDVGAVTMNQKESINQIFVEYDRFSSVSGIRLNETKSEIMCLGRERYVQEEIEVEVNRRKFKLNSVEKIKICGITFSLNSELAHALNVEEKIDSMERNLIAWLHRGLTIPGKIVITNTFGISQLIYSMQCCEFQEADLNRIESMIFKFLWNKKWHGNRAPDRIKRSVIKGEYNEGGLKVPDIKKMNEALKLKQFMRAAISSHPIKLIQKFQTESLDYDFVYQQEYARMCEMDVVVRSAQGTINKLTDGMREVEYSALKPYQIDLLANTDVVEYLTRKNHTLAKMYFKKLFVLGIEKYIQLYREFLFPRNDECRVVANFVLRSFPKEWRDLMMNNEINDDVNLTECLPWSSCGRGVPSGRITVKMIRGTLNKLSKIELVIPILNKLGIRRHENVNPFLAARKANKSVNLAFFKYRLLHGDIYSKERMFKFKMVNDENCDFCGRKESIKHMLWDCERVKRTWDLTRAIFTVFDPGIALIFDTVFVGFSPTNVVLESILTRITRTIIARDRSEILSLNKVKFELIEHCNLNIYSKSTKTKDKIPWRQIKNIIEEI